MVFSDSLFLYLFLPLVFLAYGISPRRLKNTTLLLASLLFYWVGEKAYLLVMLCSIAFNYVAGRLVDRYRASRGPLIAAITLNLLCLFVFKYAHFVGSNLSAALIMLGGHGFSVPSIHLPVGISFFTFQAISYVVDVHRHHAAPQRDPIRLALYISSFPQLIAGPIVRYQQVERQLEERSVSFSSFSSGAERFTIGLAKKTMLANPLGEHADVIFGLHPTALSAPISWLGLVCYTLQIYLDFSGYSDMAIGLGRMFGFSFPENFNYPYLSRSVTEFWKRWHITLSSWLRDYLYIPLGGSRVAPVLVYRNLLIVFVLCGFWHGASWNFLIWGLMHGALLTIERTRWQERIRSFSSIFGHIYVLFFVMLSWVFFKAEHLYQAKHYLGALFGAAPTAVNAQPLSFYANTYTWVVVVLGVCASTPLFSTVHRQLLAQPRLNVLGMVARPFVLVSLLTGSGAMIAAGTYNPFIYFRF